MTDAVRRLEVMKMKRFLALAAIALLFFAAPARAAHDERLIGTWEHRDEEYAPVETTTFTFRADGTAYFENRLGGREQFADATWETDGKRLRVDSRDIPEIEDTGMEFGYRAEGEKLILILNDGEEMIFTRKERTSRAVSDKELVGRWAMSGVGVGYSGGYGEVLVMTLGADGRAVFERTEGCMITGEPATWESDGRVLRVIPAKKPERGEPGGGYTYSVDGRSYKVNNWPRKIASYGISLEGDVLRLTYEGEEMVLTRKERGR